MAPAKAHEPHRRRSPYEGEELRGGGKAPPCRPPRKAFHGTSGRDALATGVCTAEAEQVGSGRGERSAGHGPCAPDGGPERAVASGREPGGNPDRLRGHGGGTPDAGALGRNG